MGDNELHREEEEGGKLAIYAQGAVPGSFLLAVASSRIHI